MNETLLLLGLMIPLLLGAWLGGQMLPSNWLAATNAFSGAFLFAVTVFLWMPTLAESSHIGSVPSSNWGLWIVIGYFLQFALDGLSKNSAPQSAPRVAARLVEAAQVLEGAGDIPGAAASLD